MDIFDLPQHLHRLAMVTHMHEMALKSDRCDEMLRDLYKLMAAVAESEGVLLSTICPTTPGIGYENDSQN